MYRIGMPFWRAAAKHGFTMKFRIDVKRDEEAGVYYATSPDIDGLVVEAETFDELGKEIFAVASTLLELELSSQRPVKTRADLRVSGDSCFA